MESQELTACTLDSTLPLAARLAISTIEQYLRDGVTPEQLARAMAEVEQPRRPRQASLPL